MRGQALVEFTLIVPVLMALILAMIAIFYLDLQVRRAQNGIDVLAQLAAQDPGWRSAVSSENERTDCNADPLQPDVEYPDQRVLLTWHCHLNTRWIFDGLPITVSSEAVVRASDAP